MWLVPGWSPTRWWALLGTLDGFLHHKVALDSAAGFPEGVF